MRRIRMSFQQWESLKGRLQDGKEEMLGRWKRVFLVQLDALANRLAGVAVDTVRPALGSDVVLM